jgi:hypothetical protein
MAPSTSVMLLALGCAGAGYALARATEKPVVEDSGTAEIAPHLHWDESQERRGIGKALVKLVRRKREWRMVTPQAHLFAYFAHVEPRRLDCERRGQKCSLLQRDPWAAAAPPPGACARVRLRPGNSTGRGVCRTSHPALRAFSPTSSAQNFDRHGAWFTMGNVELHLIKGVPLVPDGTNLIVGHLSIESDCIDVVLQRLIALKVPCASIVCRDAPTCTHIVVLTSLQLRRTSPSPPARARA